MRFFISSNIKKNKPLYITVVMFLISSLLFWIGNWLWYHFKYGLTYQDMFSYFFTDPEFPERLPISQLLEDMHIDFFINTIFIMIVASIFLHKCVNERIKFTLVGASYFFMILEVLSGLIVYFVSPIFIYLKVFLFVMFQLFTGSMILMSLKLYLTKEKEEPPEKTILYGIVFAFTAFTVIYTIMNFFLFLSKLGLTPQSVSEYYLGNPEKFMKSKSLETLIKVAVPHFMVSFVYLLALVHFAFFTNLKRKVFWTVLVFLSFFVNNACGFAIRYGHPFFAYVKLASFVVFTFSVLYLSLVILFSILRFRSKAVPVV